jgi:hypothetical protein
MAEPIVVAGGLLCVVTVVFVAAITAAERRRDRREDERRGRWAARHGWTQVARPVAAWTRLAPGEVRFAVSGPVRGRRVVVAESTVSNADGHTTHFVTTLTVLRRRPPDVEVERVAPASWHVDGTDLFTVRPGRVDLDAVLEIGAVAVRLADRLDQAPE